MTFFFYGPNSYALKRQLRQMMDAFRAKTGSDFGLDRINGAQTKPRELQQLLQASPFLANSRLVIVENLSGNKAVGDKLPGILEAIPETTVAVFVEETADQRTTVFKVLSQADKVVKFDLLPAHKLIPWSKAEIERLGGTADRAAVTELVDLIGEDQWRLSSEINKLVNYNAQVTTETVRRLVEPSMDQSIFDLVDAMTAGRPGMALSIYQSLLQQKMNEMYVLTMIQWQLRNLLLAKTSKGMSPPQLAKAAGLSPYVASKAMAAAAKHDETALKRSYLEAADCEFNIKIGRLKSEMAVEQLIFRVANG